MGLDNYWMFLVSEGKTAPTIDWEGKEPKLCGGMFSGHGNGSFRGKVYASLIETLTGESLYDDIITNNTIKDMARKLQEAELTDEEMEYQGITRQEFEDLVWMFKKYAEAGAVLVAWW